MHTCHRYTMLIAMLFALSACGGSSTPVPPVGPPTGGGDEEPNSKIDPRLARLQPGLSCTELKSYIADAFTDNYLGTYQFFDPGLVIDPVASDYSNEISVSQTNLQEIGVDESDIVKTDSQGNMFIADGNRLVITSAYPAADMHERAVIDFAQDDYIRGIILDESEQRLIVEFDTRYYTAVGTQNDLAIAPPSNEANTKIKFFDISDLDQPIETKTLNLTGSLQDTRYTNGELLMITSQNIISNSQRAAYFSNNEEFKTLVFEYRQALDNNDTQLANQRKTQVRAIVGSVINGISIAEFLPSMIDDDQNGLPTTTNTLDCDDIYAPNVSVELGLSVVYRINSDGDIIEGLGALKSLSLAYVGTDSIFMYQRSSQWWWTSLKADETAIHQISYSDGPLSYIGVGIIPGTINNRFSMSEHDGYLRVASNARTHDADRVTTSVKNHLSVLQANDNGTLDIVGSTPTYADGEQIFSARFVGDRGYVVTFRQIDPLFSFDLSQPTAPTLEGELEIPGFSEYIHPVGPDRLITIGRNGDADGLLPGVRLQLFDVSDLSNPTLLHSYVPTTSNGYPIYSWSVASYDHHAFTYIEESGLLVLPLLIQDYDVFEQDFSGFVVMRVNDADGFTELGRIDHHDLAMHDACTSSGQIDISNCISWHQYSWVQPRRSVIISNSNDSIVYSLSNLGVKASFATDPSTVINTLSLIDVE